MSVLFSAKKTDTNNPDTNNPPDVLDRRRSLSVRQIAEL